MGKDLVIQKSQEMQYLQAIKEAVFELDQENLKLMVQTTMKLFDVNYPISFNKVLLQYIYSAFISQRRNINIYFQFLKEIETSEEQILQKKPRIFTMFEQYLLRLNSKESKYILVQIVENKLIRPDFVKNVNDLYFGHLISKEQLQQVTKSQPNFSRSFNSFE